MQLRLNAFLLREGLSPLGALTERALKDADFYRWSDSGLVAINATNSIEPHDGDVIASFLEHPTYPPPWQRFVAEAFSLPNFGGGSKSAGAVVFCAVEDDDEHNNDVRWIAWCFGSGFRWIRKARTDPRFGLLIALNTASPADEDPPRLRSLEYRVNAPYFQQAGHRASSDTPVEGFRVDVESDLVSAAGAHTTDAIFGDVFGGRSIQFKQDVNAIDDLKALAGAALARWRALTYKAAFKWVDNMIPVSDEPLIEQLRTQVVEALDMSPIPNWIDVLIPDDLVGPGDERTAEYIAYPRERAAKEGRKTLTIEMVAGLVQSLEAKDPGQALDADLRFFDGAKDPLGEATILECLTAELHVGQEIYVAHDGHFYSVDKTFVERVDESMNRVEMSTLTLPCYEGGTEPAYIGKLTSELAGEVVVLDRALLRVEGETPVEACDAVTRAGALVHLKRKGKSALFSHLCTQASGSCSLLKYSQAAQEQLLTMIMESGALPSLVSEIDQSLDPIRTGGGVEVVFGILGKWGTRTLKDLPLVSKVALAQSVRRIEQMGFTPTALLIDRC